MPQGLLGRVTRKLVCQAGWQRSVNRHSPPIESGRDGASQYLGIQSFTLQQYRQIEIVLQPAVGHPEQGDSVQFLRNNGVNGSLGEIEQACSNGGGQIRVIQRPRDKGASLEPGGRVNRRLSHTTG